MHDRSGLGKPQKMFSPTTKRGGPKGPPKELRKNNFFEALK